jgi:ABC-2 type transport system ATP-binding protein
VISVSGLAKTYRVAVHRSGMAGAVLSLARRQYRTVDALADVTFSMSRGELVGYLGPNGAGKSTTVKILAGVLVPSAGEVRVRGRVPWKQRSRHTADIGVVFGQRTSLWWDLPVIESLDLLRHVYAIPRDRYLANLALFTQILGLDEFLHTPVRSLSLGQRMRSDLAAALLHDPSVVFLDEPTIGLDVVAKERIRGFILEISGRRGVTVVLTTHDLGDVQRLCKRVLLIDHGRLLFDGGLAQLVARFGGDRELVVDLAEDYDVVDVDGATVAERDGARVTYRFAATDVSASALIARVAERFRVSDLTVREPEIEATVRRIYEERLLSPPAAADGAATTPEAQPPPA